MTRPLAVSLVIPVADGGRCFRRCLASVGACVPPASEVIVVADGSTDDSASVAAAAGARVLNVAPRRGPAFARNAGARVASGDVLLFVDADVEVPPDTIGRVRSLFDAEPQLDALFGSYDDDPAELNFLSQYKNLLHHYVHQTGREEASTFWAGCGAVRRSVFLEAGGFDERFARPSIEDIDLGYRLRAAGHRIRLCKELRVKHLKRWSISSLLRSDVFDRALPWTKLIWARGAIDDLNLRAGQRASALLAMALLLALAVAPLRPLALAIAAACAASLLALNAGLYRFFWRERGPLFTLCAVPWHWFYFVYSTAAFAAGTLARLAGGVRS